MKEIRKNNEILNKMGYMNMLKALIYKELEGSPVEIEKTDEELEKFINDIADEWFEDDYLNLVPEEIHNKIFKELE